MFRKITRISLIEKALSFGIGEGRSLGDEIVLKELEEPTDLQKRILELNENFEFNRFFSDLTDIETAIEVITPKQNLIIECELVDNDNHGCNCQALYDAIYDSKINILPVRNNTSTWQQNVMNDGNIVIQITKFGDFYIWCPENITDFQLSSLQELNERLKKIQYSDLQSFQQLFLDIHAWILGGDETEKAVELLDDNIDLLIDTLTNSVSHKKK